MLAQRLRRSFVIGMNRDVLESADAAQGGSQPTLSTGRVEERDSVVDQSRAAVVAPVWGGG